MSSANQIREAFLNFFNERDHEIVSSSPLVPMNDPTLMFTNAGMVQFKNVFTGAETRPYSRAVTSQKCVRAGGKHNDLDNVGYTARHHTFFEMLGNFSFGDYFKEEAILYAWDLITGTYGLNKDKLLVTVYHEDNEAYDLWKKIAGLPDERIIRIATSDNFWAMGDTGPCGPCSEIFYDHGEDIAGGPPGSPDEDGDRFIEIWNLVFMQYEQIDADTRVDLPKPSIDTGMGLERLAAVLQGKHNNYEVDTFQALINASQSVTGTKADGQMLAPHRVIADHLRASSFLIADGVLPSNEGRGYVLRRIMRRAMRQSHILGYNDLLMHQLVPALVTEMGQAYPELQRAQSLIQETLKLEEGRFKVTLERGLRLLNDEVGKLGASDALPGDVAFKLYDTYGFPLDLTEDALRAQDRKVDVDGFSTAMERQKAEARASWKGSGAAATDDVWFDVKDKVGASEFLGYDANAAEGEVQAIIRDGKPVEQANKGDDVAVIMNQTTFYGESGGQMGDEGTITSKAGAKLVVNDTKKQLGSLIIHMAHVNEGTLKVGDVADLMVDKDRRQNLRANHSVTHLMHEALRRVLGDHVSQKGSLVMPERLRFDFAHSKPMSDDEIQKVESDVNALIRANSSVATRLMTPDEAIKEGAMALFGEKYGDEVRVVSMGEGDEGKNFSVELCGGTHVGQTGEIGVFKIISESAVASGVRRIEAVSGAAAFDHLRNQENTLLDAAAALKVAAADLKTRVTALMSDRKAMEKELGEARRKLALGGGEGGKSSVEATVINGVNYLGQVLDGVSPKDLRGLIDDAKKKLGSGVVCFVTVNDGKAALVLGVTDDLTTRYNAVDLIRIAAEAVGGKGGGGRPDMAQTGGPDGAKAQDAVDAVAKALEG